MQTLTWALNIKKKLFIIKTALYVQEQSICRALKTKTKGSFIISEPTSNAKSCPTCIPNTLFGID